MERKLPIKLQHSSRFTSTKNELAALDSTQSVRTVVRVIGVGGAGCNAVNQIFESERGGAEFFFVDTDQHHLGQFDAARSVQIGTKLTRGLGTGSDPEIGRLSAEEDKDRIRAMLIGTDILFIIAVMGRGTGTGAAPVIAKIARDLGVLTIAVAPMPFSGESVKRRIAARVGARNLLKQADSLVLIDSDKSSRLGKRLTMKDCFKAVNNNAVEVVSCIADLIKNPGYISLDMADIRAVLHDRGMAATGVGFASGEERAQKAVAMALDSLPLGETALSDVSGLLVNIACDESLSLMEFGYINQCVENLTPDEVDIKLGTSLNLNSKQRGELRVSILATGLSDQRAAIERTKNVQGHNISRDNALPQKTPTAVSHTISAGMMKARELDVTHASFESAVPIIEDDVLDVQSFLRHQESGEVSWRYVHVHKRQKKSEKKSLNVELDRQAADVSHLSIKDAKANSDIDAVLEYHLGQYKFLGEKYSIHNFSDHDLSLVVAITKEVGAREDKLLEELSYPLVSDATTVALHLEHGVIFEARDNFYPIKGRVDWKKLFRLIDGVLEARKGDRSAKFESLNLSFLENGYPESVHNAFNLLDLSPPLLERPDKKSSETGAVPLTSQQLAGISQAVGRQVDEILQADVPALLTEFVSIVESVGKQAKTAIGRVKTPEEIEIEEMIAGTREKPPAYATSGSRNPVEYLKDHYGRYLDADYLYQDQLRTIDRQLYQAIHNHAKYYKKDIRSILPPKSARGDIEVTDSPSELLRAAWRFQAKAARRKH